MSNPDSLDKEIVKLLGQNARQSSSSLARQLKISPATIRRRLRKLFRSDVLRIIGVVEPAKFGSALHVVIALDIATDKLESALNVLVKEPEVRWVSSTTGRFDIIAIARFPSTDLLSSFLINRLAQLDGLKNSEALVCLDVKKGRYVAITE